MKNDLSATGEEAKLAKLKAEQAIIQTNISKVRKEAEQVEDDNKKTISLADEKKPEEKKEEKN